MIKIAICDDEIESIERIQKLVECFAKENAMEVSLRGYQSKAELLESNLLDLQILFLDVEISNDFGIEVGHSVRTINKNILIVYVSSYIQYAPRGYEVNASAYLLKDSLEESFPNAMKLMMERLNMEEKVWNIWYRGTEVEIKVKEIDYILTEKKNINILYRGKVISTRYNLKEIYEEIKEEGFIMVQQGLIINLEQIAEMKNYIVRLKSGEEFTVSQRRWQEVKQSYLVWKVEQ